MIKVIYVLFQYTCSLLQIDCSSIKNNEAFSVRTFIFSLWPEESCTWSFLYHSLVKWVIEVFICLEKWTETKCGNLSTRGCLLEIMIIWSSVMIWLLDTSRRKDLVILLLIWHLGQAFINAYCWLRAMREIIVVVQREGSPQLSNVTQVLQAFIKITLNLEIIIAMLRVRS